MQLTPRTRLAALAAAALALVPRAAAAHPYETFISVDNEEDLYDLNTTGQLDDESLAELVEVMQRGVDLNRADREELYSLPNLTYQEVDAILAYRQTVGWIRDPVDLVAAGVLSADKLEAIAGFLVVSDPRRPLFATDGWIRSQARWTVEDDQAPPLALQARVSTLQHLTVGMASVMTRNRVSDVSYDPTRGALIASAAGPQVHLPKLYARWEGDRWGAIAGTYRIGFGQRLTFDDTHLYTPNGFEVDDQLYRESYLVTACKESAGELSTSPCSGPAGDVYTTPDFHWRDGLLGAAAGFHDVPAGAGSVQGYAFASYSPRSIYQYEIYDRDTCADPHDDSDPGCAAPLVYKRQADPVDPTSRFSYETLPDMFAETTVGGNLAYSAGRRTHVGVTGYGSSVNWLTSGIDLDFQEWSLYPYGGPFGAVGVDGAVGVGANNDLFGEVTRSFDSTPGGGGGMAGLVRLVTTFDHQNELESSVRYYSTDFNNPYARPIAAADELEGARARDEAGVRLRYSARLQKRLSLRALSDLWRSPSDGSTSLLTYERSDLDITDQYGVGLWALYENKDLGENGVSQCFESSTMTDENGEPVPCAGEKYQVAARFRYTPTPRYSVVAQYQHSLLGDTHEMNRLRQDAQASLIGTARPRDDLRLRARARYLFQDIFDNGYLEQSLWTYVDATYRLRARDSLSVRYDLYWYLDDRASTAARVPSPEHWLWLEYESHF